MLMYVSAFLFALMVCDDCDGHIFFERVDPECHAAHRPVWCADRDDLVRAAGDLEVKFALSCAKPVVVVFLNGVIQVAYDIDALLALRAGKTFEEFSRSFVKEPEIIMALLIAVNEEFRIIHLPVC